MTAWTSCSPQASLACQPSSPARPRTPEGPHTHALPPSAAPCIPTWISTLASCCAHWASLWRCTQVWGWEQSNPWCQGQPAGRVGRALQEPKAPLSVHRADGPAALQASAHTSTRVPRPHPPPVLFAMARTVGWVAQVRLSSVVAALAAEGARGCGAEAERAAAQLLAACLPACHHHHHYHRCPRRAPPPPSLSACSGRRWWQSPPGASRGPGRFTQGRCAASLCPCTSAS